MLVYQAEHDAILKKRENPNSSITWEEYKSMTFTLQVCNMTQPAPFLLTKTCYNIISQTSM